MVRDPKTAHRQFTARATALFTAVALLGLVVLAGVGAAGALTYSTLTSERADLEDERADLAGQRNDLEAQVAELESSLAQLAAMNAELSARSAQLTKRAASSFERGLAAGREAEREALESAGHTYADGWRAGRAELFAAWEGGWQAGSWYIVQIGEDANGPRFTGRFARVRPCQGMYVANDLLYLLGPQC